MNSKVFVVLAAMGGAALWGGAAEAACPQIAQVQDALRAGNLEAGRGAARSAAADRACSEEEVLLTRGIAELIRYNEIATAVTAGAPMASFEKELRSIAAKGAPPWQVHDMLGDIARSRKDYATAASDYFMALSIGSTRSITPDWSAPTPEYIRYLHQAGTEMRLAADESTLIATRGGCQISYRGVEIAQKTVPIRFVVAKSDFTEEGAKSAESLFNCLKSSAATDITLIGHTDPQGPDGFNQRLSEARAKAVADYLYAKGYNGKIDLVGKGETEPFQPDDPGAYDEATLFQMHRRVDVVVNDTL